MLGARGELVARTRANALEEHGLFRRERYVLVETVKNVHASPSLITRHSLRLLLMGDALAAVEIDRFAGEERQIFGVYRRHQARDVFGSAVLASGNTLRQVFSQRTCKCAAVEIGLDVAGRDVHDPDACRSPFHRQATRHGSHGGLGRAISQITLYPYLVEERADIDDDAAARALEIGVGLARTYEHRSRIRSHDLFVGRGRERAAHPFAMDPGIVDQSI